jgi:hypothetical protein
LASSTKFLSIGNKFHSTRSKEETTKLPRSSIPGDRYLAAITEKLGYDSWSNQIRSLIMN